MLIITLIMAVAHLPCAVAPPVASVGLSLSSQAINITADAHRAATILPAPGSSLANSAGIQLPTIDPINVNFESASADSDKTSMPLSTSPRESQDGTTSARNQTKRDMIDDDFVHGTQVSPPTDSNIANNESNDIGLDRARMIVEAARRNDRRQVMSSADTDATHQAASAGTIVMAVLLSLYVAASAIVAIMLFNGVVSVSFGSPSSPSIENLSNRARAAETLLEQHIVESGRAAKAASEKEADFEAEKKRLRNKIGELNARAIHRDGAAKAKDAELAASRAQTADQMMRASQKEAEKFNLRRALAKKDQEIERIKASQATAVHDKLTTLLEGKREGASKPAAAAIPTPAPIAILAVPEKKAAAETTRSRIERAKQAATLSHQQTVDATAARESQAKLKVAEEERDVAKTALRSVEAKFEVLQSEHAELQTAFAASQQCVEQLRTAHADSQSSAKQLQTTLEEKEATNRQLLNEQEARTAQLEDVKAERDQLRQERDDGAKKLETSYIDGDDAADRIIELIGERAHAEREAAGLRQVVEEHVQGGAALIAHHQRRALVAQKREVERMRRVQQRRSSPDSSPSSSSAGSNGTSPRSAGKRCLRQSTPVEGGASFVTPDVTAIAFYVDEPSEVSANASVASPRQATPPRFQCPPTPNVSVAEATPRAPLGGLAANAITSPDATPRPRGKYAPYISERSTSFENDSADWAEMVKRAN